MSANSTYYTRNSNEIYDQYSPILNGRHQLDYDYNGALSSEDDSADHYDYNAVRAVLIA